MWLNNHSVKEEIKWEMKIFLGTESEVNEMNGTQKKLY